MDYESNAALAPKNCSSNRTSVQLDDLMSFAQAVELQAEQVNAFCARFFGEAQQAPASSQMTAVPSGYSWQLRRIETGIDELHKAIQRLSEIG